jgi:hypothetical protein
LSRKQRARKLECACLLSMFGFVSPRACGYLLRRHAGRCLTLFNVTGTYREDRSLDRRSLSLKYVAFLFRLDDSRRLSTSPYANCLSSKTFSRLQVLLAKLICISLVAPVQRSPLGLVLEQAHSLRVLQTNISTHFLRTQLRIPACCPKRRSKLTFCSSVVKRW